MFVILDSNHYREFARASVLGARLNQRLASEQADAFTTIVTIQEVSQGWLAEINSRKPGRDQLHAYQQFQEAVDGLSNLTILPFAASRTLPLALRSHSLALPGLALRGTSLRLI